MVTNEREIRRRNEDRETRKKLHRGHDAVGACSARRLHQVQDAAITHDLDAIESEGRSRAIAHEPFAARVITLRDPYGAVDVEAAILRRETSLFARLHWSPT